MIVPSPDDKGMMGAMMAQMGGLAGMAGLAGGGPNNADLYQTMLYTETVQDPIINRFKLMTVYGVKFRAEAYKALFENTDISIGKKDGVITIAVDDIDPKRAADIANAYVDELGHLTTNLSMSGASKNRAFLEERLVSAKADLARAEDAMKNFQSKYKAVSIMDQAKASIEAVALLRGQLAAQEVQLGMLQRQFTENSQEVKMAKTSIANIRTQIADFEGSGGSSSIPSVGSVPELGKEYVRLLREFKIQETLVELLTKQYEMVKLDELKDVSSFQVIQSARPPEKKSSPQRGKLVVISSCAVFILVASALVAGEHFASVSSDKLIKIKSLCYELTRLAYFKS
ncbi:lipopolysaccharide biosynthesis protein [Geoanaerobacter pelophilus]|uniref:Lipopolysaccharide biosynthesis protein n=2 Tax=Geoanaerobacter pelophilus TaxID=60036 RepID=A0ABQ0MFQ2_9BACT|nr:lipopolysaccharide biosynthesis protein [Geoanaerobacter pelophilus]